MEALRGIRTEVRRFGYDVKRAGMVRINRAASGISRFCEQVKLGMKITFGGGMAEALGGQGATMGLSIRDGMKEAKAGISFFKGGADCSNNPLQSIFSVWENAQDNPERTKILMSMTKKMLSEFFRYHSNLQNPTESINSIYSRLDSSGEQYLYENLDDGSKGKLIEALGPHERVALFCALFASNAKTPFLNFITDQSERAALLDHAVGSFERERIIESLFNLGTLKDFFRGISLEYRKDVHAISTALDNLERGKSSLNFDDIQNIRQYFKELWGFNV